MATFKATKGAKKLVSKPAPEPEVIEQDDDVVEETPKAVKASTNRGRTTGLPVMKFQDKLLAENNEAMLTDEQLLQAMRDEYPNAKGKIFTADLPTRLAILKSVRALFNRGAHGKQTIDPPPGGVFEYNADGEIVGATKGKKSKAA